MADYVVSPLTDFAYFAACSFSFSPESPLKIGLRLTLSWALPVRFSARQVA